MRAISTRDLGGMPDIRTFRRLTRSLAMLDAILAREWEHRYYSFDSQWGPGELMASMRNGHGDHWFALLTDDGVVIHGLHHEAPMYRPDDPWPGLFEGLPPELSGSRDEPAFDTRNSTFCIWRRANAQTWERGPVEFSRGDDPDGSAELLEHLDGRPETYVSFAAEYYGLEIPLDAVANVYRHTPLTTDLVARLNPAVLLTDLGSDLAEIGYPDTRP
jgi:hypothetical protein